MWLENRTRGSDGCGTSDVVKDENAPSRASIQGIEQVTLLRVRFNNLLSTRRRSETHFATMSAVILLFLQFTENVNFSHVRALI